VKKLVALLIGSLLLVGVGSLVAGAQNPRVAQMNDKAEWRCMYAGQTYSHGARVCGSNGYIQTCNQGAWTATSSKC
jgi:hypothetical protein